MVDIHLRSILQFCPFLIYCYLFVERLINACEFESADIIVIFIFIFTSHIARNVFIFPFLFLLSHLSLFPMPGLLTPLSFLRFLILFFTFLPDFFSTLLSSTLLSFISPGSRWGSARRKDRQRYHYYAAAKAGCHAGQSWS